MKKLMLLISSAFIFTSCIFFEFDEYDELRIASWVWWVLGIGFVLFVFSIISAASKSNELEKQLEAKGMKMSDFKKLGSYVGGHPDIDKTILRAVYKRNGAELELYDMSEAFKEPTLITFINIDSIKSIDVEDASTLEKKVTLGRVLLVGIFALAWRKKKKNELAFVVLLWNDGKFDHHTTFSFEGIDAMGQANIVRNELIRAIR